MIGVTRGSSWSRRSLKNLVQLAQNLMKNVCILDSLSVKEVYNFAFRMVQKQTRVLGHLISFSQWKRTHHAPSNLQKSEVLYIILDQ